MSEIVSQIPQWVISVIIGVFSLFGIALIIERVLTLFLKFQNLNPAQLDRAIGKIENSSIENLSIDENLQSVGSQLIEAVKAEAQTKNLEARIESIGLEMVDKFDKNMPILNIIATVAPLLGLLGTVTGMIKSFSAFSQSEQQQAQLMGGVDEALITTALGLAVAIPALIAGNLFAKRINKLTNELNLFAQAILKKRQ